MSHNFLKRRDAYQTYYIGVLLLFFFFQVLVYGRGVSHDVTGSSTTDTSENASKAPFLIGSCLTLFCLAKSKKNRFEIWHIENYKYWKQFLLILFLLIFFRNDFSGDLKSFGTIFFSYLALFLLLTFAYSIRVEILEKVFIYFSFALSILSFIVHVQRGLPVLFFPDRAVANEARLGGVFYYAHTAAILGITLLFALKKYLSLKEKKYLIISALCTLLLVFTDTRSAWFSVFFSFVFLKFSKTRFSTLFVLSILSYFVATSISSFFASGTSASVAQEDTEFRLQIWGYCLKLASNHLLTGYGNINPLENDLYSPINDLHDPHNSIISLLLQSGIFSVVFYFFIYFRSLRVSLKTYDNTYRFLFFFWAFFPFYWGYLYNSLSGFLNFYILFTIYAFALNPNTKVIAK